MNKSSGHQQRWPRPLPEAILIPPALLLVADLVNGMEDFRWEGYYTFIEVPNELSIICPKYLPLERLPFHPLTDMITA
jgi:hypothetical protein